MVPINSLPIPQSISTRSGRVPSYNEVTSNQVYNDFDNYKLVLGKVYAGYAISEQEGPDGDPDISGLDEGFSNYLRLYFNLQELTTDEAVIKLSKRWLFIKNL